MIQTIGIAKPWILCVHLGDSITEMLDILKWTTLEMQRKHSHLLLLFKLLNKLIFVPDQLDPNQKLLELIIQCS